MRVNIRKLISDLLLTFTRNKKFIEIIRVLAVQIDTSYNQFSLQVPEWIYKTKANASVISLEHHIKRELDVDAVITELDGKPIDFLVTVTGFVDDQRLKSLIDDYKLAGKSYVFKVGSVVYTAEFTNHLCENIREEWIVEFSESVCEKKHEITFSANVAKTTGDYQYLLTVTASDKVTSDIFAQISVKYLNSANELIGFKVHNVTLYASTTTNSAGYNEVSTIPYTSVSSIETPSISITPTDDNNNIYISL